MALHNQRAFYELPQMQNPQQTESIAGSAEFFIEIGLRAFDLS